MIPKTKPRSCCNPCSMFTSRLLSFFSCGSGISETRGAQRCSTETRYIYTGIDERVQELEQNNKKIREFVAKNKELTKEIKELEELVNASPADQKANTLFIEKIKPKIDEDQRKQERLLQLKAAREAAVRERQARALALLDAEELGLRGTGGAPSALRHRAPPASIAELDPLDSDDELSSSHLHSTSSASTTPNLIKDIENSFNAFRYPNGGNVEDVRWRNRGHREGIMLGLIRSYPQKQWILAHLSPAVKAEVPGLFQARS